MGELVRTPTFHDLASELNVPLDARNDARNVDRPFTGSGG